MFGFGSANSISALIGFFEDSYLLFSVQRFSRSPKQRIVNPKKIYGIDTGFVKANSMSFSPDFGRASENAVFLHLRRSTPDIWYYRGERECDFITRMPDKSFQAIQVCYDLHQDSLAREVDGLTEAMRALKLKKGLIVTREQEDMLTTPTGIIDVVPGWKIVREK